MTESQVVIEELQKKNRELIGKVAILQKQFDDALVVTHTFDGISAKNAELERDIHNYISKNDDLMRRIQILSQSNAELTKKYEDEKSNWQSHNRCEISDLQDQLRRCQSEHDKEVTSLKLKIDQSQKEHSFAVENYQKEIRRIYDAASQFLGTPIRETDTLITLLLSKTNQNQNGAQGSSQNSLQCPQCIRAKVDVRSKDTSLKEIRSEIKSLKNKTSKLNSIAQGQAQSIESLLNEKADLIEANQFLHNKLEETQVAFDEQIKEIAIRHKKLKAKLATSVQNEKELEEKMKANNEQNDSLKKLISEKETENQFLTNENQKLKDQLALSEKDISSLKEKCQELKEELQKNNESVEENQQEAKNNQNALQTLHRIMNDQKEEMMNLQSQRQKLISYLQMLNCALVQFEKVTSDSKYNQQTKTELRSSQFPSDLNNLLSQISMNNNMKEEERIQSAFSTISNYYNNIIRSQNESINKYKNDLQAEQMRLNQIVDNFNQRMQNSFDDRNTSEIPNNYNQTITLNPPNVFSNDLNHSQFSDLNDNQSFANSNRLAPPYNQENYNNNNNNNENSTNPYQNDRNNLPNGNNTSFTIPNDYNQQFNSNPNSINPYPNNSQFQENANSRLNDNNDSGIAPNYSNQQQPQFNRNQQQQSMPPQFNNNQQQPQQLNNNQTQQPQLGSQQQPQLNSQQQQPQFSNQQQQIPQFSNQQQQTPQYNNNQQQPQHGFNNNQAQQPQFSNQPQQQQIPQYNNQQQPQFSNQPQQQQIPQYNNQQQPQFSNQPQQQTPQFNNQQQPQQFNNNQPQRQTPQFNNQQQLQPQQQQPQFNTQPQQFNNQPRQFPDVNINISHFVPNNYNNGQPNQQPNASYPNNNNSANSSYSSNNGVSNRHTHSSEHNDNHFCRKFENIDKITQCQEKLIQKVSEKENELHEIFAILHVNCFLDAKTALDQLQSTLQILQTKLRTKKDKMKELVAQYQQYQKDAEEKMEAAKKAINKAQKKLQENEELRMQERSEYEERINELIQIKEATKEQMKQMKIKIEQKTEENSESRNKLIEEIRAKQNENCQLLQKIDELRSEISKKEVVIQQLRSFTKYFAKKQSQKHTSEQEVMKDQLNQIISQLKIKNNELKKSLNEVKEKLNTSESQYSKAKKQISEYCTKIQELEVQLESFQNEAERGRSLVESKHKAALIAQETELQSHIEDSKYKIENAKREIMAYVGLQFCSFFNAKEQIDSNNFESFIQRLRQKFESLIALENNLRRLLSLNPGDSIESSVSNLLSQKKL